MDGLALPVSGGHLLSTGEGTALCLVEARHQIGGLLVLLEVWEVEGGIHILAHDMGGLTISLLTLSAGRMARALGL